MEKLTAEQMLAMLQIGLDEQDHQTEPDSKEPDT